MYFFFFVQFSVADLVGETMYGMHKVIYLKGTSNRSSLSTAVSSGLAVTSSDTDPTLQVKSYLVYCYQPLGLF